MGEEAAGRSKSPCSTCKKSKNNGDEKKKEMCHSWTYRALLESIYRPMSFFVQKPLLQYILHLAIIFTHLCHEGRHLKSQLFVHREVTLVNFIIHLVRQKEALSLRLSFHLRSETQPVQARNNKNKRKRLL